MDLHMSAPKVIATVLTVAAVGSAPAVASASAKCSDSGGSCRIALNHNEILVTSP